MTLKEIKESLEYIIGRTNFEPEFGIVLGTGLGDLVKEIISEVEIPYDDIPNFPVSTVESHHGKLIFGYLSGKKVMVMQGRFHFYEGYTMAQIVLPIRVMKLLGIEKLFISNAAGSLNPEFKISDLMILNDHINLFPTNPLIGKNIDDFGPRFPDMSSVYNKNFISKALELQEEIEVSLHQGVYAGVPGPNLETPAEYKYLRTIGSDAVGMSTIPEVIAAQQMNMKIFAISVITDICTPGNIEHITVEKVIAAASKAEPHLTFLIKEMIREL